MKIQYLYPKRGNFCQDTSESQVSRYISTGRCNRTEKHSMIEQEESVIFLLIRHSLKKLYCDRRHDYKEVFKVTLESQLYLVGLPLSLTNICPYANSNSSVITTTLCGAVLGIEAYEQRVRVRPCPGGLMSYWGRDTRNQLTITVRCHSLHISNISMTCK